MGCGSTKSARVVVNGTVSVPSSMRASVSASAVSGSPPKSRLSRRSKKSVHLSTEILPEVEREELTDESSDEEKQETADGIDKDDKTGETSDGLESEAEELTVQTGRPLRELESATVVYVTCLSTDKKVYRPGERLFLRAVMLDACTQRPPLKTVEVQRLAASCPSVSIQQPYGQEVTWNIKLEETDRCGAWGVQISIPNEAEYGTYVAKATYAALPDLYCAPAERSFAVRKVRKQRLKLKLEFAKKNYVAGDKVHAVLTTSPSDGESQTSVSVTANATFGNEEIYASQATVTTGSRLPISFQLPSELPSSRDVILVCRVTGDQLDATITEHVPLPVRVQLCAYPECGYLVAGLQCGLYFQAHCKNGDPVAVTVEVQERMEDSDGILSICTEESVDKHGGYLSFFPKHKRSYRLVTVVQSRHLSGFCDLPKPRARGVSLSARKAVYEGGSPIWLRVGSSSQGSYCLKAFKLGNELFSVDFSFPSKMSNFASTRGLDGLKRPEKYQDVVLSLPSYVSGAVWVAVSNKKGMTVAERMIFVNCARRLKIVTDAVWSSPSSAGKKDLEVSIETFESKSGMPVCSHIGVTVTGVENFSEGDVTEKALLLDKTSLFPEINLSGMECLNLSDQMGDNCLEQSLVREFAALKQQQSSQEIICEACNVPASTFGQSPNGQSKTVETAVKRRRGISGLTLAQRLSSFERLTGVTSQKRTSLDEKVQQLVASPTLMLWRAIEEMSVDRLTAAMGTLQIQDLRSISWRGETLVHGIARFHRMKRKERVRTLLKVLLDEAGLDVNAQREGWSDGNTALHLACERGNHVVAEVLIELGATRSLLNTWGVTPLALAAGCGHTSIVQLLLEHDYRTQRTNRTEPDLSNSVPHHVCGTGWSPLHYAAAGGHVDVIRTLKIYASVRGIELDFNVITTDELHLTPLHCAARYCTVSEMAARVIEYLLGNGANDVADVRGYSYKQLAYLKELEHFGRLSRYGPIQQATEVSQNRMEVDVNYRGQSKILTDVAPTADVAAVLRDACQEFGISVHGNTKIPFFFIDKHNQCLVDQTVPCAAAVTIVSNDSLSLCRIEDTLQTCLDMTLYEFLCRLIAVNNVDWEGPVLPDHGCVQQCSFFPTSGWSHDPKNLDLRYTPAEYGLQEGDTIYFYSQLIPEEKFPRRSICLEDYGILGWPIGAGDSETTESGRSAIQLKLCPLDVTGTVNVVVLKDQPNREPPTLPESIAPAAEVTQNQPKSSGKQQGKKAPPKEAPKKAPAKATGKGRGPPGKPLKLNLSSFEQVKTVKEILLSQLGDHLQKEANIDLDTRTQALTCDIYVGDVFQQDAVPLYASSLHPLPTPAVIKVHPRIMPHYSNLSNLFDFWTTPACLEMNPEGSDSPSDPQTTERINETDVEHVQEGELQASKELVLKGDEVLSGSHDQEQKSAETQVELLSTETDTAETIAVGESVAIIVETVDPSKDTIEVTNEAVETIIPNDGAGTSQVNVSKDTAEGSVEANTNTELSATNSKPIETNKGTDEANSDVLDGNKDEIEGNTEITEIKHTLVSKEETVYIDQDGSAAENNQGREPSPSVEAAVAGVVSDQNFKPARDGSDFEEPKRPTEEEILKERRRLRFLAWYERWKTGMLWWGIESLRGHTSFLRWVKADESSQTDKIQTLQNAEIGISRLAQDYRDSVDPIVKEEDYDDEIFEDDESEGGKNACRSTTKIEEETNVTSGVKEPIPVELTNPVCKLTLGVLDWDAALGHKQGPAVREGMIVQPCLVWGDRSSQTNRSTEPLSSTVYWTAAVKTDASGKARFKVSVDPDVGSYELKVDAFSPSGALGRVQRQVSTQNPLRLEWSMPDYLNSGDALFVPLTLSNSGLDMLDVELSCVLEGATFQVCRLLSDGDKQKEASGEGVVGRVTVPRSGAFDFMEIQLETLSHHIERATMALTATAGKHTSTVHATISLQVVDYWEERSWAGCIEEGETVTSVLQVDNSVNAPREDTRIILQGFDTGTAIVSAALDYLCSAPSLFLEHAASIAFVGAELLQHYKSSTVEYQEVELTARRTNNAIRQLIRCRGSGGGFSRFCGEENGACMEATSFALVMLGHLLRLRNTDLSIVARARDWLMEQLVEQRRCKRVSSVGKPERHRRRLVRSYALWALTESEFPMEQLNHWMDSLKARVRQLRDPYLLALSCLALYNYGDAETGNLAADRLVNWQKEDGRVSGTRSTLMSAGETAKDVETTSLALLCWLKRGGESGCPVLAFRWVIANFNKGNFGSAHCTAIAVKALMAYHNKFGFRTPGELHYSDDETDSEVDKPKCWEVQATVNEGEIETLVVPHSSHGTQFQLSQIGSSDSNEISVKLRATESPRDGFLPLCVQAKYKLKKLPELGEDKQLEISVIIPENIVLLRSRVRVHVVVKSHCEEALEFVICQIGIPKGLRVERNALDQLKRDQTLLTACAISGNTTYLCFRLLPGNDEVGFDVDCVAAYAGRFSAPPSCTHTANDSNSRVWCPGINVIVAVDAKMRTQIEEEQSDAAKRVTEAKGKKTAERASEGGTLSCEGLKDEQLRTSCFF